MSDVDKLNQRQETFCWNFVQCGNATKSYQAAYGLQIPDASAAAGASRLLKNVKVLSRIREIRDEISSPKIMTISEIQARLSEIIDDTETATGAKITAARCLLQSLGAFDREPQNQINVYSDADETIIQLPPLMTESECEWDGPEEE